MRLSLIAAVASNRVIGLNNGLPWHLPADLRFFRQMTEGHHLIMGRKTLESLKSALSNRRIIVVSRQSDYSPPGVLVARSLDEAIGLVDQDDEPFVAGGARIYEEALDRVDRMYLTRIHADFPGDTFFPEFDESRWVVVSRSDREPDEKNPYPLSFIIYERTDT